MTAGLERYSSKHREDYRVQHWAVSSWADALQVTVWLAHLVPMSPYIAPQASIRSQSFWSQR